VGGGVLPHGTGLEGAPTHFAVICKRDFMQKFKLIKIRSFVKINKQIAKILQALRALLQNPH